MELEFENDVETLAAVLAFLEDVDATDGDPHRASPALSSQDGAERSTSAPPATCGPRRQPAKGAKSNRNGARAKRQREIKQLQGDVAALETQLETLQEAATQRAKWSRPTHVDATTRAGAESGGSLVMASEWRELASRQLEQRVVAERENNRLKQMQEDQRKLAQALSRVLRTRLGQRVLEACKCQDKRTRRVHAVAMDSSDAAVFRELEDGVDEVYHEALAELRAGSVGGGDSPGGAYAEKTLPFDIRATANAAWRCLTQSCDPEKRRSSYQKDSSPQSQAFAGDDTVLESFGVELHTQQRTADFRIKQVFRRYVGADQVVIAWRSFVDPVQFKGETVSGVRFQENGTTVVSAPDGDSSGTRSLVRTWFTTTLGRLPRHVDAPDHHKGFYDMGELRDFVPNGSSSGNAVQMIENLLLEQTIAGQYRS